MNLGYAPVSDFPAGVYPVEGERLQYELYWQTFCLLERKLSADAVVCEVSCGMGGGLAFLKRLSPGQFIGLERSYFARKRAARKFDLDVRPTTAPLLQLDDASVDVMLCVESAHNYHNEAFLAEIRRCLKPGGVVLLSDFNLGSSAVVKARLGSLYERAGFDIEVWRDVRSHVLDSMRLDNPRKEQALAKLPTFLRKEARGYMGLVDSYKYRQLSNDERAYFMFRASMK